MEDFEGKVAVVTGAASGIGRGLAQRFAEEGMRVVLADVEADALDAAVTELRDAGHEVRGEQVDVSSQPSVDALAQAAFEAWGGVHVVCNNAGVAAVNDWGSLHPEGGVPMWDLTLDDWRWTYGVNFWGVVHGIRAFTPLLLEQGEPAHIVNTGSVQSFQGGTSLVAYSSTKFAVGRITEALQMQLSELGSPVRAHLLCPGGVATRSYLAERNRPTELRNPDPGADDPERAAAFARARDETGENMGRNMPPSGVAAAVVEGLRAERFYIFSHGTDFDAQIRARMERIIAREDPQP